MTHAQKVAKESIYQRAAAEWVGRQINKPAEWIRAVTFSEGSGGGCDTCGYGGEGGIEFYFDASGRYEKVRFPHSAGQFIEECVAILDEL